MITTTTCLCPNSTIEGTLLNRDQIETISSRIAKNVENNVHRQLKAALEKRNTTSNLKRLK